LPGSGFSWYSSNIDNYRGDKFYKNIMKNVYIIANWKMQQTPEQALAVARDLVAQSKKEKIKTGRQVVICPTFTELPAVAKILPSRVALGLRTWLKRIMVLDGQRERGDFKVLWLSVCDCRTFGKANTFARNQCSG
jgi:hypothetical protein